MNPADILTLPAGSDFDKLLHAALGLPGRIPKYTTDDAAATRLIGHLPLFVSRVAVDDAAYNAAKPYIAGSLTSHPQLKALMATLTVKAETLPMALSRAALLFIHAPKEKPRMPSMFQPKPAPRPAPEPMPTRSTTMKLPDPIGTQPAEGGAQ